MQREMETCRSEEQENTIRKTEKRTVWRPILSDGKRRRRTQGIYSQRELRELIVYERARADRAGHELSVVLCEMNGHASSHKFVAEAVHALSRSIRHTDHLGWYDRGSLGIILPLTSHVGARQFVESLMQMPDNGHRNVARELDMSIHSCPDKWLDSPEDQGSASGDSNSVGNDAELSFIHPVPQRKRALDVVGSTAGLIVFSPLSAQPELRIKIISGSGSLPPETGWPRTPRVHPPQVSCHAHE